MTMRILFTGAGGAAFEWLWRHWQGRYHLYFADADLDAIHPIIPRRRCVAVLPAGPKQFVNDLMEQVDDLDIKLIIPSVDEELPHLCSLPGVVLPGCWFVAMCLDKLTLTARLKEAGFKPPETQISKPRFGRGSRDVHLVQERLEGPEYTVMMAADQDSRLGAIVPVRVKCKRGLTVHGITENTGSVVEVCRAIHDIFKPAGCYNIQGMLTRDGFRPFEINPRISTTFILGAAAGVDPVHIWRHGAPSDLVPFHEGAQLRRYWHNHIVL